MKSDSTRGHLFQACGAAQKFLQKYPHHRATINASSHVNPYKPKGAVLSDWVAFIKSQSGPYEHKRNGYNYTTLKGYLTPKYGGRRRGGGGGDNEFHMALRLVAQFLK
jgi:hypothetical protein